MKTTDFAKPSTVMSSPHKPGAKGRVATIITLPPAQVLADQRRDATQVKCVSHEPGHQVRATHSRCAGLESFASNGDGGGQCLADNQSFNAASESFHGEGHRRRDAQANPANAVGTYQEAA